MMIRCEQCNQAYLDEATGSIKCDLGNIVIATLFDRVKNKPIDTPIDCPLEVTVAVINDVRCIYD